MLHPPRDASVSYSAGPLDPIAPLREALRGHYEIEREIGQGAFATVYLARDLKHERKVAIKVLNADPTSETGELRFIREIRLLARLQHPNILPLHDSGHVEALLYYVMPFVSGETLRDRIDRLRQLPSDAACTIAREVADALAYAHAQGIIHRDIKPENILLSAGHPILADFGIARAIDLAGVKQLTRTGMGSPGTPAYMSPEQLLGDKELDGRSDTYSLGCVLYEMLAGKAPFTGKDGFVKRFTESPPKVSTTRRDIAPWIDAVVEKALARSPRDRYPTAQEFVEALCGPITNDSTSRGESTLLHAEPLPAQLLPHYAAREITGAEDPRQNSASEFSESVPTRLRLKEAYARTRAQTRNLLLGALALTLLGGFGLLQRHRLTRFLGAASAVDSTRVVVFPLRGDARIGERVARNIRDAWSEWKGIQVVSDLELADALPRNQLAPTSLREAREIAQSVGAGKLVWGEIVGGADSSPIRAELYDLSGGTDTPPRTSTIAKVSATRDAYSSAVIGLLKDPDRPASADGGDGGTRSYGAWSAYAAGHIALSKWDLPAAASWFARAVAADAKFGAAQLWLGQIGAWLATDPNDGWRAHAHRAAAARATLSPRDSFLADGLVAMADSNYFRACEIYRKLASYDSSDFIGWYGLGECQSRDNLVLSDERSPSNWRFRSSFHSAVLAYARAFRLEPEAHLLLPTARLDRLLPSSQTNPRPGRDESGHFFAAYPSLQRDTVGFVPYPAATFAALSPRAMATLVPALDRNVQVRRDLTSEWVRLSPESADAQEALADVLETQGELIGRSAGALSAIGALHRAQALATSDDQRLRLVSREVRLHFKLSEFDAVREAADSALALFHPTTGPAAEELVPVAAFAGKAQQLADLIRLASLAPGQVTIPVAVQEAGANFFARAALGVCGQDLALAERALEQKLESYVTEQERPVVRAAVKWRGLSMSSPCTQGRSALDISAPNDQLYRMQQLFARGDFTGVRAAFKELAVARQGMRPGDVSLDYTYQEAWLRAAIGDTSAAIQRLDLALNALPTLSRAALREGGAAAAAGRAMMLRADLAAATGDKRSAQRWARNTVSLWGDADPLLQREVARMKALAGGGRN